MSRLDSYARYNRTPKGQARRRRYLCSEARRRCVHRFNTSPAGHACARRYRAKPEVREQRNWTARGRRLRIKIWENAL